MKKHLPVNLLIVLALLVSITSMAQRSSLAPDQNPRYEESRAKYMESADSLNAWHSTTIHDTYRAIDYMADRAEARAQRKAFHRELRLERARNGYGWYNDYSYGYGYNNGFGYGPAYNYGAGFYHPVHNYDFYPNRNYGRGRYIYNRPYRSNLFWNTLPWAIAAGWIWR